MQEKKAPEQRSGLWSTLVNQDSQDRQSGHPIMNILFDQIKVSIAVFTRDLRLVRFNPAWARMLSRTTGHIKTPTPGRHFYELFPDGEAAIQDLLDRILGGETCHLESVRLENAGTVSYWDITYTPIFEKEQVAGFFQTAVDVTGRESAGKALQESEANLKSLLENARQFAVYRLHIDPNIPFGGKVVLVSPSLKNMLGIEDPYLFEQWFANIHPEDMERIEAANRRAYTEAVPYDEWVRVFNPVKQEWVCVHTLSSPVFDDQGRPTHYNGLIVDITEARQAEDAYQESQRQLSTLMSNLPGMAYRASCEPGWQMEFVSEGSLELTGYSPEALIQTTAGSSLPLSYGDLVHPEDREAAWQAINSALREDQPYRLTYRISTAGGEEKWVWEQGRGVKQSNGSPQSMEGFITDITERVTAQQVLEQHVEERTREVFTILEVSQSMASTLELKPLMELILDQLKSVVDYDGASVLVLYDDILKLLAYHGPIPQEQVLQFQFPLAEAGANREVIVRRSPVIVPDVLGSSPLALEFQKTAGEWLETSFAYVRSWMGVPLIVREQVIGMLSLDHHVPQYYGTDHSQLVLAFASQVAVAIENARLYAKVRQRADETQTLLAVQKAITSRLDANSVLQMIADEARRLTETEQGAVYLLDDDELVISVVSGDFRPDLLGYRLPVDGSVAGLAVRSGQPFLISDVQNDFRVYSDIIEQVGARSFVIVPLISNTGPIGTITVANKHSGNLGPEDEWVLTMLASGAVVALENANLYREEQEQRQQAERRRRVAEGVREILAVLNSDRPLNEILEYIVSQASDLLNASAAVIYRLDAGANTMSIEATYNMPDEFIEIGTMPLLDTEPNQAILRRQPFAIPDLPTRYGILAEQSHQYPEPVLKWFQIIRRLFHAYLSIPLVVRDEVYGALSLYYKEKRIFNEEEIDLGVSFADQAALAIENARLRSQAARMAVLTERSRLARDLHDAVTQTLFSASLIAEVLPRLWDRNQDEGRRRLAELRELTRGALAEMRTLLLELRPSALVEAEVGELFRHLVEAFIGRARLPAEFSMEGPCDLPPDVKVVLYRITQEALNNVVKHAEASRVWVGLKGEHEQVELLVRDNGRGFDTALLAPENLGLGIMKERAESIGASMIIQSSQQEGTQIKVLWRSSGKSGR